MVYKGQHEQDDDVYGGDVPEEYMESDFDSSEAAVAAESKAKELENINMRLQEFEGEAGALPQMQVKAEKEMSSATQEDPSDDSTSQAEREEIDSRSIYVGNVDYACTPEEVQQHFQSCGTVNRVTILTDKFGQPNGFAYVEFVEVEAVQNALLLGESELLGRQLKELAHRQQFYFWKNYRNNRLKHILPKPLPELSNVPSASMAPPMLPPPTNTAAPVPSPAVAQAPLPMLYGMGSGSTFVKNEPRSSGIDRRKRKKDG